MLAGCGDSFGDGSCVALEGLRRPRLAEVPVLRKFARLETMYNGPGESGASITARVFSATQCDASRLDHLADASTTTAAPGTVLFVHTLPEGMKSALRAAHFRCGTADGNTYCASTPETTLTDIASLRPWAEFIDTVTEE